MYAKNDENEWTNLSCCYFLLCFPQYSMNPLNFTRLTFATTFISCLRSSSCSHEHCSCSSIPNLPVLLSHSIQQDHQITSNWAMVPEFTTSRLTALSPHQPTGLFSSMPSLLITHASISTPPPLHPVSVPFNPQPEKLTLIPSVDSDEQTPTNWAYNTFIDV